MLTGVGRRNYNECSGNIAEETFMFNYVQDTFMFNYVPITSMNMG